MGDEKRRRHDSRSPPPRSGRGGGRDDEGGRHERGPERERERERDGYRERERDRERERGREPGQGGRRDDRGEDDGRGPAGAGRSGPVRVKEEPLQDAPGPRGQAERDRERRPEREQEREDWGGRGDGGVKRERERYGDRDGEGRGGGGGGPGGREPKRERGSEDWGPPGGRGGRGGGRGGGGGRESDARYMSREEREAKEREAEEAARPKAPKEEPNMGLSGKLAAETNKVAGGTVLKHVPPADAKLPDKRWRLYVFKNEQLQDEPYRLHKHDHFLFGRDVGVADIITAHVSCSKQHAVLQYRLTAKEDEVGLTASAVRPYLLDLGSVNGTFLNGERVEPLRYYELLEKDVIRFGQSSREYVLLHDKSGDA